MFGGPFFQNESAILTPGSGSGSGSGSATPCFSVGREAAPRRVRSPSPTAVSCAGLSVANPAVLLLNRWTPSLFYIYD
jgi:hypothetical protein